MLTRDDDLQSLSETFTYDDLDRLTSAEVTGQTAVNFAFDAAGSITQKSDVADTYDYLGAQKHAVTLVTLSGASRTLNYDANGNFASGTSEPSITWSSYNKPTQLSKGPITYNFDYGPDRKRYRKQKGGVTTHYIGTLFEKTTNGGTSTYRHTIRANGRVIMIREATSTGHTHRYLHRDHLGSVTAITDESTGTVQERLSYDAWGQRRSATNWTAATITASDHRGYTGHEHLDDIGVIHMNGRIYSPSLGRMLSPDPVTQAPENGQNYDRYTYVFNNPLRYTDPSGYCGGSLNGGGNVCREPNPGYHSDSGGGGAGNSKGQSIGSRFRDKEFVNGLDSEGHSIVSDGCTNGLSLGPGGCSPVSQSGDLIGDGVEAVAQLTLLDGFEGKFLEAYAKETPLEAAFFIEFASQYRYIATDEDLIEYFNGVIDDFGVFARKRALEVFLEGPRKIAELYYSPSGPLVDALPKVPGTILSGIFNVGLMRGIGAQVALVRQATEIRLNGVRLNEFLLDQSFYGED